MNGTLEIIINELLRNKIADEAFFESDLNCYHFSLGQYIRNKYLWNNENNVKELEKVFNKSHPDGISLEIVKVIYNMEKNKKI